MISHKCAYPGCSHPTGHEANRVRSKFCGESVVRAGYVGAPLRVYKKPNGRRVRGDLLVRCCCATTAFISGRRVLL